MFVVAVSCRCCWFVYFVCCVSFADVVWFALCFALSWLVVCVGRVCVLAVVVVFLFCCCIAVCCVCFVLL